MRNVRATADAPAPDQVLVVGVAFATTGLEGTVARLCESAVTRRGEWLLTPNTSILRRLVREPALRKLVSTATIVVPDGQPVLWLSRFEQHPLSARVTGSDILPLLMATLTAGSRVGFVGGAPGVAAAAADQATRRGLDVVGHACPARGFREDPSAWQRVVEEVVGWEDPQVLVFGLPFPLQEELIVALRERRPEAVYLGVGAALGFYAGAQSRAHPVAQKFGLEWLWRLCQEPGRLARRYLVQDLPFLAVALARAAVLDRARRGVRRAAGGRRG